MMEDMIRAMEMGYSVPMEELFQAMEEEMEEE